MTRQTSPPFVKRNLGRTLKRLREQAAISFAEAYQRLEFSSATLSRIESGKTAPTVHTLRSMLDLYGVPADEWDEILQLTRQAKADPWWKPFASHSSRYPFMSLGFTELEAAASKVRSYEPSYFQGLLQTSDYASAVLRTSLLNRSQRQFAGQVAIRLGRQRRLYDVQDPLCLEAVIDETVVRRRIGSVEVMAAQLAKVEEMIKLPNVTLRVVPLSAGAHLGLEGSFSVLEFPHGQEGDAAFSCHVAGAVSTFKSDVVELCGRTFNAIKEKALDDDASAEMIKNERLRLERHGWQ